MRISTLAVAFLRPIWSSWGSAGFAGGGQTAVTVRCDLLFTTAVTESPLTTLRKTATPRRPLRSLLEA